MSEKSTHTYRLGNAILVAVITEVVFWGLAAIGYFGIMRTIAGTRFQHPQLLWFLCGLPLISLLFIYTVVRKNRALLRFSDGSLLGFMVPDISTTRLTVKYVLLRLAMGSLIIALVNPQVGSKLSKAKSTGAEIMVDLDVSNSMLAQDIQPSRLERAKRAIQLMIDQLAGHKIGLTIFAGEAYVDLPLTTDYDAAKLFLNSISTESVPTQGTLIGPSIRLAASSFDKNEATSKVIILITDGEDHDQDALKAAQDAAAQGIKIYTVGMGSPQGSPIPVYNGSNVIGYKKDKDGKTVISKLNESLLRQISDAGNGTFTRASTASVGLTAILKSVNKLKQGELGTLVYSEYEDRFMPFLAVAFALIFIELLIGSRKPKWLEKWNIFEES